MNNIEIYAISFKDIIPKNTKVINVTSSSKDGGSVLSPFFLGEVVNINGKAKNVENAWQFSKVYKKHLNPDNSIKREYFEWREKGFSDSFAHRYPMGKGAIPEFSLLGNERLDYQEAKDRMYTKMYVKALKESTQAKQFLKNIIQDAMNNGHNIAFKDYDVNLKTWKTHSLEDIIFSKLKCGHGYLVAHLSRNYVKNFLKNKR